MTSFRTEWHVTWLCMDVERGVASVTMVGLTAEEAPSASAALERMDADEDMRAEAASLSHARGATSLYVPEESDAPLPGAAPPLRSVRLNWYPNQGGHQPTADTQRMLREAGGRRGIRDFTDRFYEKAFADPVLDRFIREHDDPHGARFADWVAEKFGDGTPWTDERRTRKTCPFATQNGHTLETPHDRSSAHFAAWHSPKREPAKFGSHFKLDDCRVWMRLHFWALRESGVVDRSPSFAEYYVKFIGHFVSVYERQAPPFARESFRWSADPANTQRYLANGNRMEDGVVGVFGNRALAALPASERNSDGNWPYC